jgi:hypothetical protein
MFHEPVRRRAALHSQKDHRISSHKAAAAVKSFAHAEAK